MVWVPPRCPPYSPTPRPVAPGEVGSPARRECQSRHRDTGCRPFISTMTPRGRGGATTAATPTARVALARRLPLPPADGGFGQGFGQGFGPRPRGGAAIRTARPTLPGRETGPAPGRASRAGSVGSERAWTLVVPSGGCCGKLVGAAARTRRELRLVRRYPLQPCAAIPRAARPARPPSGGGGSGWPRPGAAGSLSPSPKTAPPAQPARAPGPPCRGTPRGTPRASDTGEPYHVHRE